MLTIHVDSQRLNGALDGLRQAMIGRGQDISNILVQEQKLLAITIVNFTPPSAGQSTTSAKMPSAAHQKTGEDAVKNDLYSLISEANPAFLDKIATKYGVRSVNTHVASQEKGKTHLIWDNIDLNGADLPRLHAEYRNRRGRIPKQKGRRGEWKSRVVVPYGKRDQYVKQVQARVGRWQAKWALAASQQGAKFPAYISRHFSSVADKSYSIWTLNDTNGPSVMFGGRGPSFARQLDKIRDAIRVRTGAIVRKTKLIISGYNKDIAAGMKPKRKTTAEGMEA